MARGDWNDVYLVHDGLRLHTDAEVDAAEAALGVRLPDGYRELVTTLGDGVLGGLVRVCPPGDLEARQEFLEGLDQAWSWEGPNQSVTPEEAVDAVLVADTIDGDMVIFQRHTRQLHVLPRHDEDTYAVGGDLWALADWLQESGVLTRPSALSYFESFVGPTEAANGDATGAHLDHVAAPIRSLGLHDHEDASDTDVTFFVEAIGGYLSLYDVDGTRVGAHLRYQTDRGNDERAALHDAAVAAGVTFGRPWTMAT